ncbi:MAG: hypothetical protein GX575_01990 [Candidatus Anammoximicrobium sp.]|nr:hypothetical protein [Candidatus Anammoximicrobium sp.]
MTVTKELLTALEAPARMTVLAVELNYGFRFQSHPDLECRGPDKAFFQQQGFSVLLAPWENLDAAVALIRCARKDANERMQGVLLSDGLAGGNCGHLLDAWKAEVTPPPRRPPDRCQHPSEIEGTGRRERR